MWPAIQQNEDLVVKCQLTLSLMLDLMFVASAVMVLLPLDFLLRWRWRRGLLARHAAAAVEVTRTRRGLSLGRAGDKGRDEGCGDHGDRPGAKAGPASSHQISVRGKGAPGRASPAR